MDRIQCVRVIASLLMLVSTAAHAKDGDEKTSKAAPAAETQPAEELMRPAFNCKIPLAQELVIIRASGKDSFGGMTGKGGPRLVLAQEALKITTNNFNQNFEGMAGIHEMDILTMATRQNNLSLGPPGAAKSARLTWLIPDIWTKQFHEMMTDAALFGGQTRKGLENGQEDRNTTGSALEAKYVMADEFSNANPSLGASLLSYMNPGERYITIGGKKIFGATRAVFATGNATRAQLLKNYTDRGLFTGPAMLNRSIFKSWVPNWLTEIEQTRRDDVIERMDHLKNVKYYGEAKESEEAVKQLAGLESKEIDMEVVEAFAQSAFVASVELKAAVREFSNKFRARINEKVRASEEEHRNDAIANPLIKTPSAEWTERFRSEILRVIRFSAALDYLRMSSPDDLKRLKKPITLNPMSIWRAMYVATTVGPGTNRFDPASLQVQFNMNRLKKDGDLVDMDKGKLKAEAKDKLEIDELDFMWEEQALFNEIILGILKTMSSQAKAVAAIMASADDVDLNFDSQDFEIYAYRYITKKK